MEQTSQALIRQQCLIDGEWRGEPSTPVINPASGDTIARVPNLGAAETRGAIDAASRAFPAWSGLLAKERAAILRRWYELQLAHAEEIAQIMTAEQGKPLAESRGEVSYGASFVEFFAEEAKRIYGETIPTHRKGGRIIVHRQPVGVVGAITPWNFPFAMITRKVAPALAVGCTVVVKPAPDTPLTALALGELALQGRFSARRPQHRHGRRGGHRQGIDLEPACAGDHLHGLDTGRQAAHAAIGGDREKGLAGTGRERAVYCVR